MRRVLSRNGFILRLRIGKIIVICPISTLFFQDRKSIGKTTHYYSKPSSKQYTSGGLEHRVGGPWLTCHRSMLGWAMENGLWTAWIILPGPVYYLTDSHSITIGAIWEFA
jgi:hypothetical protein